MAKTKNQKFISVQMIAEAGIMIALSVILGNIKLFRMPAGGSITLGGMAPLFVFAIRWGFWRGLIVGAIYGILDQLLGGYVVNILQALLDYPLAFAMTGFAGLKFGKSDRFVDYLPGMALAVLLRFLCHVISGTIYFPDTANPLWNSVVYNATFLVPDLLICLALIAFLWKPIKQYLRPQL